MHKSTGTENVGQEAPAVKPARRSRDVLLGENTVLEAKNAWLRSYILELHDQIERQSSKTQEPDAAGWLWDWLMQYCRANGHAPQSMGSLFKAVSEMRAMLAAAAHPAAEAYPHGYPHGHPLHREVFTALESFTGGDTFEDRVRGLISELLELRASRASIEINFNAPQAGADA